MVAPVPYIIRLELNGSISTDAFIQPSFGASSGGCGLAPKVSHGLAETSMVKRLVRLGYPAQSQIGVHDVPPLVLRQKMVSGHHEIWLATMMVLGFCRSMVRPLKP